MRFNSPNKAIVVTAAAALPLAACGGSSGIDSEPAPADLGDFLGTANAEEASKAVLLERPEEQELAFYALDTNNMTVFEQEQHSKAKQAIDAAKRGDFDAATLIIESIYETGQVVRQDIQDVIDLVAWERARDVAMDYGQLAVRYVNLVDNQGEIVNSVARDDIERGLASQAIDLVREGFYDDGASRLAMIDDVGSVTRTQATDEAEEYIVHNARGLAQEGFFAEALEVVDNVDSNGKMIGVVLRDEIESVVVQEASRQYESGDEESGQVLVELIDSDGQVTRSEALAYVKDR